MSEVLRFQRSKLRRNLKKTYKENKGRIQKSKSSISQSDSKDNKEQSSRWYNASGIKTNELCWLRENFSHPEGKKLNKEDTVGLSRLWYSASGINTKELCWFRDDRFHRQLPLESENKVDLSYAYFGIKTRESHRFRNDRRLKELKSTDSGDLPFYWYTASGIKTKELCWLRDDFARGPAIRLGSNEIPKRPRFFKARSVPSIGFNQTTKPASSIARKESARVVIPATQVWSPGESQEVWSGRTRSPGGLKFVCSQMRRSLSGSQIIRGNTYCSPMLRSRSGSKIIRGNANA